MILQQVKQNAVAIISLAVALSSLAYNTWRNESSEANETTRDAGFFMMQELSDLQEIVLFARYDQNDARGDIKSGWSHVLAVKDISYAMPATVQQHAHELLNVWQQHASNIPAQDNHSYKQVDSAIDEVKQQIVLTIKSLK